MATVIDILKNYLFVQIWILLFVFPFYLFFSYFHHELNFKKLKFNDHLEDFLSSPYGNALIFTWAAAEAVYWFVIPEFFLLLVVFLDIKNKNRLIVYDFLGTIVGTLIGIVLYHQNLLDVRGSPFIHPNMLGQVQAWMSGLGVFGLLFQPFSGVPYKVFVAIASISKINISAFVLMALLVRMARYFLLYVIFQGLYPFLHRFVSRNYIPIFFLTCFVFAFLLEQVYKSYAINPVVDLRMIETIKEIFHLR